MPKSGQKHSRLYQQFPVSSHTYESLINTLPIPGNTLPILCPYFTNTWQCFTNTLSILYQYLAIPYQYFANTSQYFAIHCQHLLILTKAYQGLRKSLPIRWNTFPVLTSKSGVFRKFVSEGLVGRSNLRPIFNLAPVIGWSSGRNDEDSSGQSTLRSSLLVLHFSLFISFPAPSQVCRLQM